MARQIALLRGINVGARNRIAMPELRDALADAGFGDPRTHLQSGNVILSSTASSERVAERCKASIADRFGLDVDVVVRTRAELAEVVQRNPLGAAAEDPKWYQVSFLGAELDPDVVKRLEEVAQAAEQVVVIGREVYAWHPETIARSRLWSLLAGRGLGVTATSRNWNTVTSLLSLAEEYPRKTPH